MIADQTMVRTITCERITGAVLAGGRGTRMGGADKGLVDLAGRPLAAHVLAALREQVGELLVSANRNLADYETLGSPVVADTVADFPGPLAGMARVATAARTPYVVTVPCDTPCIPADLVARLAGALEASQAPAAIVHDGRRPHPVIALFCTAEAPVLERRVRSGRTRVMDWVLDIDAITVDFSDCPARFVNVNTEEQLHELQRDTASC